MKLKNFCLLSIIFTNICCHKYFIKQIPRPQKPPNTESSGILMSKSTWNLMKSQDSSEPAADSGSAQNGVAQSVDDATSPDASQATEPPKKDEPSATKPDPTTIPIVDQEISKYLDQITIYLKGSANEDCKIDHLLRNGDRSKFDETICTIGTSSTPVVCKAKCNEKVVIEVNSGRSTHYFRIVEGSNLHILAIPADMPRNPESDVVLKEEEALFSVNNFCTDNYKCRVKVTKYDRTLIKVENNSCTSHNISVPIRYSISDAYYSYCGANQAKVMFYANKSFYNKDNKYKYVPFTVTQSTTTKTNFALEMHNPYMNTEICHFRLNDTSAGEKDKCSQTGNTGADKCFKYCGGPTTIVWDTKSDVANDYTIKIATRHGNQDYKVKGGKNTVDLSEITETSINYQVSNLDGTPQCYPSLVYAKLPGVPMTKICGDERNSVCDQNCSKKTPLKLLTPNTAYILEMVIGPTKDDSNKFVVNKFFATRPINFSKTQALFFGDTMIIKPVAESGYEPYLPKMTCYVRYTKIRIPQKKVVATCSDGKPCFGLCSHRFEVINLPVHTTISVELVHAGQIDHPVFQVTKLLSPNNDEPKKEITFNFEEKKLTIVSDSTKPGKFCNIAIYALNPTDANDKFLYEIKGKSTDEDIDCAESVVFDNIDTSYKFELLSGDDSPPEIIEEIEVAKQGSGGWMKKNWWIILVVIGALLVVIGGIAYMANKSSD